MHLNFYKFDKKFQQDENTLRAQDQVAQTHDSFPEQEEDFESLFALYKKLISEEKVLGSRKASF